MSISEEEKKAIINEFLMDTARKGIEKAVYDQAKQMFSHEMRITIWKVMEDAAENFMEAKKTEIIGSMENWFSTRLPEIIETNSRKLVEKYTSDFTRRILGRSSD